MTNTLFGFLKTNKASSQTDASSPKTGRGPIGCIATNENGKVLNFKSCTATADHFGVSGSMITAAVKHGTPLDGYIITHARKEY